MSSDFDAIVHAIGQHSRPVILLEGTRQVPPEQTARLQLLAERLAVALPEATFRSGNAQGSDTLFFQGLHGLAASRLESVLPYPGSGRKRLPPGSPAVSLADITGHELQTVVDVTLAASPALEGLIRAYLAHGQKRHTVAAMYLLRDALKVTGAPSLALAPADQGFFFVNPQNPDSGGTGHTIRVCHHLGVPVYTQDEWGGWCVGG